MRIGLFLLCLLAAAPSAVAADLTLAIAGPEEIVVSADDMTCASDAKNEFDVPDVPPTAYRWPDGGVTMIAGNRQNYRFDGPDLDRVARRGCRQLLESAGDPDPSQYRDQEWITALYSVDGRTVLGLVHNEYHGEYRDAGECRTRPEPERECWYASATLVISTDGGRSFQRPEPPGNVIMALPWTYETDRKREGIFMPKVVGGPDGQAYVFATYVDRNENNRIGQCLARGSGAAAGPWELWTGDRFAAADPSPYGCSGACIGQVAKCAPVVPDNLFSVKYVPHRKLYVAVGIRRNQVFYRTSGNLVDWSEAVPLMTMPVMPLWKPGDPAPGWYVSLLDPSSSSRNFDTLERRPYLYYVRFRLRAGELDRSRRDILRIPISIQ